MVQACFGGKNKAFDVNWVRKAHDGLLKILDRSFFLTLHINMPQDEDRFIAIVVMFQRYG